MKYYKNYIAAALCFGMILSTGCSSNSSSYEKTPAAANVQTTEATKAINKNVPDIKASDGNTFQTMRFSFSVGDNVKYETHEDNVHDGENNFNLIDKRTFSLTCDDAGIEEISVQDVDSTNCTPEFYMKNQEGFLAFDENGWTLTKNGDNDIASYCTSFNDNTGTCEAVAEVMCQGIHMSVCAVCKPESLENARKIVDEIARSTKYIGSYQSPDGEQSYDGRYFSAKCDLPWEMLVYEHSSSEEVEFSLLGVDDYKKYPVSLDVIAFSDTRAGYADASEFADDSYKSKTKSSIYENVTSGKEELKGFEAYTVECDKPHTDYTKHEKYWFFDRDGIIFEVIGSWNNDDEEYKAEVMELIDTMEIK